MKHRGGHRAVDSHGTKRPNPERLVRHGPLAVVTLTVPDVIADAMIEAGKTPPHEEIAILVDTGASLTSVHDEVIQKLGVHPIRTERITGVSGKPEEYPVYRLSVHLGVSDGTRTGAIAIETDVVGMPASGSHPTMRGLLGRDFLRHFRFVYDGPNAAFELSEEKYSRVPPEKMSRAERRRAEREGR